MGTKFCRDCREYRPVSEFSKNARSRDGLAFYCRTHLNQRSLRSREARRVNPRVIRRRPASVVEPDGYKWCADCEKVLPVSSFVRATRKPSGYHTYCKPCHNQRSRISKDKHGGSRTYHLTRRYGITAAEADFLLEGQGGVCAICRTAPAVHVDHDHATGAVRALLCFNCNGGLGQFKDDPELLRAAAQYVVLHSARQQAAATSEAVLAGDEADGRPEEPPVGSHRRPDALRTSSRSTGRTSGSRRREQAGEADG